MNDINKTIKHFQSLQRRYIKTHQDESCQRVEDALEALKFYKSVHEGTVKLFGTWKVLDKDGDID